MKNCVSAWRLAALPLSLAAALASSSAVAQSLKETVVTVTRSEQNLADLVGDVSIVDRDTIERSGAVGVADVLARLPGVEIARNGGQGNTTSLFLRGAETRFTAVYIDGIRIDSQATGGAAWEQIPLSSIDRIEVLRGPAAAVYGSDAVGGVIQIFTKKGEGKPAPTVGIGVGSRGTYTAEAGISGTFSASGEGSPVIDYALGISHEHSDGFNSHPLPTTNPDDDGYKRTSGTARIGLQLGASQRVEASFLASNLNSQYDVDPFGAPLADDRNHNQLRTAGLAWISKWSDRYSTRVQVSESTTQYNTTPSIYLTETTLRNTLFQNEYRVGAHLFTAALERREDQLQNPTNLPPMNRDRAQTAIALGYGYSAGAHSFQANLRRDRDSEFGSKTTGSAAYGYAITPQWRATVSAGNSFRAPTLYQRFSEYGKASLQPESGRNVEAGLRWTEGATSVGVVAYRNRVHDLIVFGGAGACASPFGCYDSVGRAEYQGVTLSANHRVAGVALRGSIDVQDPRDLDSDHLLARRARRHASFGADTQIAGWTVGAETQLSARRFNNAANTQVLGGYGVVNLYANTRLTRDLTLLARIDNLGDKNYQTALNYATEGRSLYVGLKWAPQ